MWRISWWLAVLVFDDWLYSYLSTSSESLVHKSGACQEDQRWLKALEDLDATSCHRCGLHIVSRWYTSKSNKCALPKTHLHPSWIGICRRSAKKIEAKSCRARSLVWLWQCFPFARHLSLALLRGLPTSVILMSCWHLEPVITTTTTVTATATKEMGLPMIFLAIFLVRSTWPRLQTVSTLPWARHFLSILSRNSDRASLFSMLPFSFSFPSRLPFSCWPTLLYYFLKW